MIESYLIVAPVSPQKGLLWGDDSRSRRASETGDKLTTTVTWCNVLALKTESAICIKFWATFTSYTIELT